MRVFVAFALAAATAALIVATAFLSEATPTKIAFSSIEFVYLIAMNLYIACLVALFAGSLSG